MAKIVMSKRENIVVEASKLAMPFNDVVELLRNLIINFKIFSEMEHLDNLFGMPEICKIVILNAQLSTI